jgi:predicted glycosyltransferase
MRGLFYCQHLIGMGHLIRSLTICKSLVHVFDIDFLQGGFSLDLTVNSEHFNHIFLPPLWREDWNSNGSDPYGKHSVESIFTQRQAKLKKILNTPYDFFITEYFPFSKFEFKDEILEIIRKIKTINPKCKVICSLRDIVDKWSKQENEEATRIFLHSYDYVFVHGDPSFIQLEDSFPLSEKFSNKIIYTGYVTDLPVSKITRNSNSIIISMGTGSFGDELIIATVKASKFLPEYEFHFILGPKTKNSTKLEVEKFQKEKSTKIFISNFISNFTEKLSEAALSISLAGYNTVTDLIKTKTPALVYPYPNQEQLLRAKKFSSQGLFRTLSKKDLEPRELSKIIREAVKLSYPNKAVTLDGAEQTKNALLKMLKNE